MKKLFPILTGIVATAFMSLALAGPASAANETATVDLAMTPQSGKLSTTERKSVNWRVDVEVKAPFPASPTVTPMKEVKVTFPNDMTFNPKSNTPVCPDDQVGPNTNLSFPPNVVIARCPTAVLGNGTAGLYLGQANSANGPNLTDPVLVVFNGGTNNAGLPKIKVYGFSQGTGAGIYMEGVLNNGVLDIQIPRLSFDSGTGDFNLNIPGSDAPQVNRRGVDSSYVQSKCSSGKWLTNAEFTLGTRNSAGEPTSPDSTVNAPEDTTDCVGVKTSKGKFGSAKVKGPKKVKKGKKKTYKVTVKNVGKATIKNAKVKVSGKGVSAKKGFGKLKKGQKKTVKIKLKFKKKGKVKAKFKITGGNSSNQKTLKKTVKVK